MRTRRLATGLGLIVATSLAFSPLLTLAYDWPQIVYKGITTP